MRRRRKPDCDDDGCTGSPDCSDEDTGDANDSDDGDDSDTTDSPDTDDDDIDDDDTDDTNDTTVESPSWNLGSGLRHMNRAEDLQLALAASRPG